jgi:hypothetical protein
MLVRALGRDEQATGIWPTGHIMVASQLGMLPTNLPGVDVAATRGIVAQLVSNVLNEPFGYKDTDTGQWMDGTESFLSRNSASLLKAKLVKAVDTTDNTATIPADDSGDPDVTKNIAASCQFVGGANLAAMKGQTVDLILNSDGYVVYMGTTATGIVSGTCTAVDKTAKTVTVGGTAYKVLDGAVAYLNGSQIIGDAVLKITDLKDAAVTLTLDKDSNVTFISATKLAYSGTLQIKQSAYSAGYNQITVLKTDGTTETKSINSDATFARNGVTATWADLQVGDDVKYAVDGTGYVTYVDAYAQKVTGTIQERVTTNNHVTFKVNDVVYVVIVDDDGVDAFTDSTMSGTPAVTHAIPGAVIVLTLNRDGKVTKVELQSATTTTAAVTLQSKTQTYDADGDPVYRLTLSNGSVVTVAADAVITRNNMTETSDDVTFASLKVGDQLLLEDQDVNGAYGTVKAFASVSGYVYRTAAMTAWDVFYICESSSGPSADYKNLAYIEVGADEVARTNSTSPSSIIVNGVQQVVTQALAAGTAASDSGNPFKGNSSKYPLKITSWVLSETKQCANFTQKIYTQTSLIVKNIITEGNSTYYYFHKSSLAVSFPPSGEGWVKVATDGIVHRSDAAFDAAKIAIGDKLSIGNIVVGGTGLSKDTAWQAGFVYDSADTSAPYFVDNNDQSVLETGAYAKATVAKTVYYAISEDSLLRYKVYSLAGVLLYTSDWAEVPVTGSSDSTVVYTGTNIPSADAKFTMVLTFKDYAGNTSAPVSVLVNKE